MFSCWPSPSWLAKNVSPGTWSIRTLTQLWKKNCPSWISCGVSVTFGVHSRRPGRRGRAGVKVKDVLLLAVPILVGKERLPRDVVDPDPDAAVEEELSLLDLLRRQRDVRRPLQVDVR